MTKNQLNLRFWVLILFLMSTISYQSSGAQQARSLVGGGCEGCELMYVGIPQNIGHESISSGWYEQGQKLILTGKVLQCDGRTPAANIVVYYWHTDSKGLYSPSSATPIKAREHGHLRGWIQTDAKGKYTIKTLRPAPYPDANIPAHIHLSIKEPNINEYFADLYFDDDPLYLTHRKRYGQQNRAGTEILRVLRDNDVQLVEHDIVLGLNIPNYQCEQKTSPSRIRTRPSETRSGLQIGEDCPSFLPFHAWGADKGTRACPVCKYGRFHGIEFFVGNRPNWTEIRQWLVFLEEESKQRGNRLKTYFIYGNEHSFNSAERRKQLEELGKELGLTKVALTFVPSLTDTESEVHLNKINSDAENTFIIFKHRTIVGKFINMKPTKEGFLRLKQTLESNSGNYFHLPELAHD